MKKKRNRKRQRKQQECKSGWGGQSPKDKVPFLGHSYSAETQATVLSSGSPPETALNHRINVCVCWGMEGASKRNLNNKENQS